MSDEFRRVDCRRERPLCQAGPSQGARVSQGCDQALCQRPRRDWLTAQMKGNSRFFVKGSDCKLAEAEEDLWFFLWEFFQREDGQGPFVDMSNSREAKFGPRSERYRKIRLLLPSFRLKI